MVESGGYNLRVLTGDTSCAADPWMPRSAQILGGNRKRENRPMCEEVLTLPLQLCSHLPPSFAVCLVLAQTQRPVNSTLHQPAPPLQRH